jgi:hypothetical protein
MLRLEHLFGWFSKTLFKLIKQIVYSPAQKIQVEQQMFAGEVG